MFCQYPCHANCCCSLTRGSICVKIDNKMKETEQQAIRNPEAYRRHKKDVFWQITLPLVIACLLVISLAVWTGLAASSGADLSRAANTSLMLLILPVFFVSLVVLVILIALLVGVLWLLKKIPYYAMKIQTVLLSVRETISKAADGAAKPFIWTQSLLEAVKKIFGR